MNEKLSWISLVLGDIKYDIKNAGECAVIRASFPRRLVPCVMVANSAPSAVAVMEMAVLILLSPTRLGAGGRFGLSLR